MFEVYCHYISSHIIWFGRIIWDWVWPIIKQKRTKSGRGKDNYGWRLKSDGVCVWMSCRRRRVRNGALLKILAIRLTAKFKTSLSQNDSGVQRGPHCTQSHLVSDIFLFFVLILEFYLEKKKEQTVGINWNT